MVWRVCSEVPLLSWQNNLIEKFGDLALTRWWCFWTHTHIQRKTTRLHEHSKQINVGKTNVMRLNTKTHQPVTIEEQPPEDVVEFVYLGSHISTGGADKDVELCISKARHAFRTLLNTPVWPFPSSPETQHQNQNIQYKRKICPSLLLWNLENHQINHQ